jgi:bifunctional UDP-N-acetylglucosamine pyrophosphorylase / glucosamine-1-phosphate N-acetyltransferase
MQKTEVIVLAAGKGTRMNADTPKVLTDLNGKPLIGHVLNALSQTALTRPPLIVVGYKADDVKAVLGSGRYALQTEQKGTGHAVREALPYLMHDTERIIVLYGDQPLLNGASIARLAETHAAHTAPLAMATVTVDDFAEWRQCFFDFGRIIRDESGTIAAIIEKKDATPEQREIREVNPGYYSFDVSWIRNHINHLTTNNTSGELYLTDLVGIAVAEGHTIPSIAVAPHEALGVNTPEQLAAIKKFLDNLSEQRNI